MRVRFVDNSTNRKLREHGDLVFGAGIPAEGEEVKLHGEPARPVVKRRWKQTGRTYTVEIRLGPAG